MFGSEVLDVAVGVLFMFLMLSLVCSALNELLEGALRNRARDLERGVRQLLADPNASGLVRQLYNHPLISSLFPGSYNPSQTRNLPAYIPARAFALALMDVLQPATANSSSGAAGAMAPLPAGAAEAGTPNPIQQFRQTLAALPESSVRTAVLSLIDAAGNDAVRARQNIEDWYNSGMERVSGAYKRRTQLIVAALGLALAIAVNADTIGFARYLSTDKSARALIVSRAQAVSSSNEKIRAPAESELADSLGWLQDQSGIPFGWRTRPDGAAPGQLADYSRDWRKMPEQPSEWISKFFGLLLTGLAVSLGAPFWFDVLNKFMVVRSTVKPKEKSPDEASKS